jgi:hypothetical protein
LKSHHTRQTPTTAQYPNATGVEPGITSGICETIIAGTPPIKNGAPSEALAVMIGLLLASLMVETKPQVCWFNK